MLCRKRYQRSDSPAWFRMNLPRFRASVAQKEGSFAGVRIGSVDCLFVCYFFWLFSNCSRLSLFPIEYISFEVLLILQCLSVVLVCNMQGATQRLGLRRLLSIAAPVTWGLRLIRLYHSTIWLGVCYSWFLFIRLFVTIFVNLISVCLFYLHYSSTTSFVALTPAFIFTSASLMCSRPLPTTVGAGRHCNFPDLRAGVT